MKKISKIEIVNFQSHKNTVIDDFGDFNVILGPTDSGKSAILRAIKWCLYNEPDGTEFIRQGESKASVTVHFDNQTAVSRSKGKRENRYELFKSDESVLILESFGSGPIKEVVEFHGMREVNFFGRSQSLNICDQLSLPFFLANSPIERATMIGQLAKTDVVDRAIKNTAGEIRERKSEYKIYKEQLNEVSDKLTPYENLFMAESSLIQMQSTLNSIKEKVAKIEHIKNTHAQIIKAQSQIQRSESILRHKGEIDTAINGIESLITLNSKLGTLNRASTVLVANIKRKEELEWIIGKISINDIDNSIYEIESLIEKIRIKHNVTNLRTKIAAQSTKISKQKEKVDLLKDISVEINEAIGSIEVYQTTLADYSRIAGKVTSIRENLERKKRGETIIEDLKRKYDTAYKTYEDALISSQTCPFCMSKVSLDKLETIKNVI